MSYYDDYIAGGLCCQVCGGIIDLEEPGHPRTCEFCSGNMFKIDKLERNKQRSQYAITQFKKNEIKYTLKNEKIGHFHVYRKKDNQLFQFWSGTGKITGPIPEGVKEPRGIKTLIKILTEREKKDENSDK